MPLEKKGKTQESDIARIIELLKHFDLELKNADLRAKVQALVPVIHRIRNLGASLIPRELAGSARDRILHYFLRYPRKIIHGDEITVISGINEWPRRIRELRVQFGWPIYTGKTIREMIDSGDLSAALDDQNLTEIKINQYILLSEVQDRDAAYRWNLANTIRRKRLSVQDKLLEYLRSNVGKTVTGEELRYIANEKTEWARRVRELRTDQGWSVVTKQTGRPDLPVGAYILEADRQIPVHDRKIPDDVRLFVLERDGYSCTNCGWDRSRWSKEAPRFLELHHKQPFAKGGGSTEDNLETLCNVCHDIVHKNMD